MEMSVLTQTFKISFMGQEAMGVTPNQNREVFVNKNYKAFFK